MSTAIQFFGLWSLARPTNYADKADVDAKAKATAARCMGDRKCSSCGEARPEALIREPVRQKIAGQASVARYKLLDTRTADTIDQFASELPRADNIRSIRLVESQAAYAYWSAWRMLPINFPKKELARVPEHWRSFGTRISP